MMRGVRDARCTALIASVLAILVLMSMVGSSSAEDIGFRRINVPADQPSSWPKGPWIAVPRSTFESWLTTLEPERIQPPKAWIAKAVYRAAFQERSLLVGTFSLDIKRASTEPVLIPLSPATIALANVRWENPSASGGETSDHSHPEYGTAADGKSYLRVDRAEGRLVGDWSFLGLPYSDGAEFAFQLPPADLTTLHLTTPSSMTILADHAAVRAPELRDGGVAERQIDLGSQSGCRLSILSQSPVIVPTTLLYEQDLTTQVREEEIRFEALLQIEALGRPATELQFEFPAGYDLFAVTMGSEVPVTWRQTVSSKKTVCLVTLPSPMTGRLRPLKIEGNFRGKTRLSPVLPRLTLQQGVFLAGKDSLTIHAPFRLREFQLQGLREASAILREGDIETFLFQRLRPEGEIRVDVSRPSPHLSAQVLTFVRPAQEDWTLESEIVWNVQAGSVYQTNCRLPLDWEVTDLRAVEGSAGVVTWDVQGGNGKGATLTIEFREPLTSTTPGRIFVKARRKAPETDHRSPMPVILPANTEAIEHVVAVAQPAATTISLMPDSKFEPATADALSRWTGSPLARTLEQIPAGELRWYQGDQDDDPGSLQFQPRLRPVNVQATVELDLRKTELSETYTLLLDGDHHPVQRVLVYLTEAGADPVWSISHNATRDAIIEAKRLPPDRHEEWGYPETGELWSLDFPDVVDSRLTVKAKRAGRMPPCDAGLVFVPQASRFSGIVTLRNPGSLPGGVATDLPRVDPTDEGTGFPAETSGWKYLAITDRLSLGRSPSSPVQKPLLARLTIVARLAGPEGGTESFTYRYEFLGKDTRQELHVKYPAASRLLSLATVNGIVKSVPLTADGMIFSRGNDHPSWTSLQVQLEQPCEPSLLFRSVTIPALENDITVVACELNIELPDSSRLPAAPAGMITIGPPNDVSWQERILGPLARSTGVASGSSSRAAAATDQSTESQRGRTANIPWYESTIRCVGPTLPAECRLDLWHVDRLSRIGGILCIASALVGLVLRVVNVPRRWEMSVLVLVVFPPVILLFPPIFQPTLGGLFAGAVIAMVIPRVSWTLPLRDERTVLVPTGSTRSYRIVEQGVLLLAVFVTGGWVSFAQDAPPRSPATNATSRTVFPVPAMPGEPVDSRAVFDLLVPVDASGKPSSRLPLVYVTQRCADELRRRFESRETPLQYLIMSAEYEGRTSATGVESLTARFQIVSLMPHENVQIRLPLTAGYLGGQRACLLNGIPYFVSAIPGDLTSVMVQLPARAIADRAAPPDDEQVSFSPEDMTESGPASAQDSAGMSPTETFELEFELHTLATGRLSNDRFTTDLLPVLDSHLVIQGTNSRDLPREISSAGRQQAGAEGTQVTADLGPVTRLDLRWPGATRQSPSLDVQTSLFCDVRPGWTDLRLLSQVACRGIPPREMELALPAGTIIRNVAADGLLRWLITGETGSRRLHLDLWEPPQEELAIQVHLELIPSQVRMVSQIPSFQWTLPGAGQITHSRFQTGVTTSSDYRITANPTGETLPVSTPSAESWRSPIPEAPQPQFAFSSAAPFGVDSVLTVLEPHQRVVNSQQTATINQRRIELEMVAEIETTVAPGFAYHLSVDRRLQIESVSIEAGGAERLLRWTESASAKDSSSILVLLSDAAFGFQKMTVKASMPLRRWEGVPLPSIQVAGPAPVPARYTVIADSDLQVAVSTHEERLTTTADTISPPQGRSSVGRYLTSSPAKIVVDIERAPQFADVKSLTILEARGDESFHVSGSLQIFPPRENAGVSRFMLRLPGEQNQFSLEVTGADVAEGDRTSTHVDYRLSRPPEETGPITVRFVHLAPWIPTASAPLPMPVLTTATNSQHVVVVTPVDSPVDVVNSVATPLTEIPSWAPPGITEAAERGSLVAYATGDAVPIVKAKTVTGPVSESSAIGFVLHEVWLESHEKTQGRTALEIVRQIPELPFAVPAGVVISQILIDDRLTSGEYEASGADPAILTLKDIPQNSTLRLIWTDSSSSGSWWSSPAVRTPESVRIRPQSASLLLVSPENFSFLRVTGWKPQEWLDVLIRHGEAVLRRAGTHPSVGTSFELATVISQGTGWIAAQRSRHKPILESLLTSWRTFSESIPVASDSNSAAPSSSSLPWLAESLAGSPHAISGEVIEPETGLKVSLISHTARRVLQALGLFCLLAPLGFFSWHRSPGPWLTRHPHSAWMAAGLIWWVCFVGGTIGLVIAGIGLLLALRERAHRKQILQRKEDSLPDFQM